jgi:DNA-binding NarL/FixJ family response regulator
MHKDKDYLSEAIANGAKGYLLKEDADKELFSAIETVQQGKTYISPLLLEESTQDWIDLVQGKKEIPSNGALTIREREVLKLIAEGKSSKEVADLLYISARTVERHRANIMEKLNIRKTADLVKYAIQKGYL